MGLTTAKWPKMPYRRLDERVGVGRTLPGRACRISVMSPDPNIRASNDQRAEASSELRKHKNAGRLAESEYKARVARVEQAGTIGEINAVFADLPQSTAKKKRNKGSDWRLWAAVCLITWAIWAVDVATSKGHPLDGFWPLWVMVPWGAVILAQSIDHKD